MDEWVPVPGFPMYSLNRLGQIRKESNERLMAYTENQFGVVFVGLVKGLRQFKRAVAPLVATAFIPRPYPAFDTPINLNGDRWDNRVENLMWRPRWFAVKYNKQFRESPKASLEAPLRDLATGRQYTGSFDIATSHGLLEIDVVLSIDNKTFVWPTYQRFEEDLGPL